ncbi:MAG: hypothetical protein ACHP6H_06960 [Legionellales bacterium]
MALFKIRIKMMPANFDYPSPGATEKQKRRNDLSLKGRGDLNMGF